MRHKASKRDFGHIISEILHLHNNKNVPAYDAIMEIYTRHNSELDMEDIIDLLDNELLVKIKKEFYEKRDLKHFSKSDLKRYKMFERAGFVK